MTEQIEECPCQYLRFYKGQAKCAGQSGRTHRPPTSTARMENCTHDYYDFRLCPENDQTSRPFDKKKVKAYIQRKVVFYFGNE